MKQIAIVVRRFPYGGAEKQAMEWAKYIQGNGLVANIISVETDGESLEHGIRIIGLGLHRRSPLTLIDSFITQYQIATRLSSTYDVVISFPQYYFLSLLLKRRIKSILSFRMFYPNTKTKWRVFLIRRFSAVVSNNTPQYALLDAIGIKAFMINNVVASNDAIPQLANPSRDWLIVANVKRRKKIESAILAFQKLAKYGYRLRIVGHIEDKSYLEELQKMDNEKIATFVGPMDIQSIQKDCNKYAGILLTSEREGTANILLEGMANQMPVLCSRIPENSVLVGNDEDFLFDPDNLDEVIMKVTHLQALLEKKDDNLNIKLKYRAEKMRHEYGSSSLNAIKPMLQHVGITA